VTATAFNEPWQKAWYHSKDDPYLFVTGVLGVPPFGAEGVDPADAMERWQDQFLRGFPTNTLHSVVSGHGVGKSTMIAWLTIWFVLTHYDAKCVVTANSQDQLRDNNWPEIKKWATKLPDALKDQLRVDEEKISLKAVPAMSFAVRRTASADRPEALQGIHAKHVLYLIDEASGIPDIVFEVAQGALSTDGAMAALFSNGTRASGFFYDTHHRHRSLWRTMVVNAEDVPRAQQSVRQYAETYGPASNKYGVRVQGKFPTQDDETVIALALVLEAKGRDVMISNEWPVWGVDVARFGDDSTTVAARQGNTLLTQYLREWKGLDHIQIAGRINEMYQRAPNHEKPKQIIVDTIGIGTGTYDMLKAPGSVTAEITTGCNVSEATTHSETEERVRDELWFAGREWFRNRQCSIQLIPHDPAAMLLLEKLIGELTGPTYDFTRLGKHKVESKADMKKRGIPSPNLADAFLNTFYAGKHIRDNPHRPRQRSGGTSWMAA
jgi:phage terminase large subunit